MEEARRMLEGVVGRWCPPNCSHEDFSVRMMRALLNLNAYEADAKLVMEGKRPIRTDYPLPFPAPKTT
jgi:hypothetical protein